MLTAEERGQSRDLEGLTRLLRLLTTHQEEGVRTSSVITRANSKPKHGACAISVSSPRVDANRKALYRTPGLARSL